MTAGSMVQALTVGGTLGSVEVTLSGIGDNSFLHDYGSDDQKDEANPALFRRQWHTTAGTGRPDPTRRIRGRRRRVALGDVRNIFRERTCRSAIKSVFSTV
jgi:hypothetical protein